VKRVLLSLWLLALLAGCASEVERASGKLRVFVSILPQAYFVERLGGEHVEVDVLVGRGQSPHSYEPTPRQMTKLARAHLFFSIGVPFEKTLLPKIEKSNKNLTVVKTHSGIWRHPAAGLHEQGEEHHKHAGGPDPHIWLNPRNVKAIAASICKALKRLDPEHAGEFDRNLTAFQKELDELDARIRKTLEHFAGREFYVFHPAFGYFAEAYNLRQVAVEAGGKEPSARQLAALIEKARKDRVRVIFTQPQFSRSGAEAVAKAIGAKVETMDPLAKNYISNLEDMARKIKGAFPIERNPLKEE
jgi:zinc transport system substrate-binding protein